MVGGLSEEEADLMLSALPSDAGRLWLEPLDKGLSGSKVFAARYERPHVSKSKPFVMKVGPRAKIDAEATAVELFAAPLISGVESPVYRRGSALGLIVQELRGLRGNTLTSLRNAARSSPNAGELVRAILAERLAPWYLQGDAAQEDFVVGELLKPYLARGPSHGPGPFPPPWKELHAWVHELTSCPWENYKPMIEEFRRTVISSPSTIVHGDLHSQNVLVDETYRECWPIDFAWTRDHSSPLVDLAMLECSLKFLAIPMRSDLRALLPLELGLARQAFPELAMRSIPYGIEIGHVLSAIREVRRFALEDLGLPFDAYIPVLSVMTYSLATHPGLNTPYVLASLQILCGCR